MHEPSGDGDNSADNCRRRTRRKQVFAFGEDGERGKDNGDFEKDLSEVDAQALPSAQAALDFECPCLFLYLFLVGRVALRLFCVLADDGGVRLFLGEGIAGGLGDEAANGLRLKERPLVGAALLQQEFFRSEVLAENNHHRDSGGDDRHGSGDPSVPRIGGVVDVLVYFLIDRHGETIAQSRSTRNCSCVRFRPLFFATLIRGRIE